METHSHHSAKLGGYQLYPTTNALDLRTSGPHARQTGWQRELRLVGIEAHILLSLLATAPVSSGDFVCHTVPYREVDSSIHPSSKWQV